MDNTTVFTKTAKGITQVNQRSASLSRDLMKVLKLIDGKSTFAEIIERASYGVNLYPGDVIGSGTVGTGCFLELNGTGKLNDPNYPEQWLKEGDEVVMEIEGLGSLSNTIVKEDSDFSILRRKKQNAS